MSLTLERRERHAAYRAQERYGITLTDELKHLIIREIKRTRRRMAVPAKDGPRYAPSGINAGRNRNTLNGLPAQPAGSVDRRGRRVWRYDDGEIRIRCVVDEREWALVTVLPWDAAGRARRE